MLKAFQVPLENVVAAFIKKGIGTLAVPAIETLEMYGRQAGDEFPAWSREVSLVSQAKLKTNESVFLSFHQFDQVCARPL